MRYPTDFLRATWRLASGSSPAVFHLVTAQSGKKRSRTVFRESTPSTHAYRQAWMMLFASHVDERCLFPGSDLGLGPIAMLVDGDV